MYPPRYSYQGVHLNGDTGMSSFNHNTKLHPNPSPSRKISLNRSWWDEHLSVSISRVQSKVPSPMFKLSGSQGKDLGLLHGGPPTISTVKARSSSQAVTPDLHRNRPTAMQRRILMLCSRTALFISEVAFHQDAKRSDERGTKLDLWTLSSSTRLERAYQNTRFLPFVDIIIDKIMNWLSNLHTIHSIFFLFLGVRGDFYFWLSECFIITPNSLIKSIYWLLQNCKQGDLNIFIQPFCLHCGLTILGGNFRCVVSKNQNPVSYENYSIQKRQTLQKISKYHVCWVRTIFLTSTGLKLRVEKYREMRSGQLIIRRQR